MPALKTYRGFISHAWTYNKDYYTLENNLKDTSNFTWYNHSVPEHDSLDTTTDKKLKEALRNQISGTNHVLIISGMYAAYRKWIQIEIDIALDMGKPIIGIRPRGQERTPQVVQDAANIMVGWYTPSIIQAIRDHAL